MNTPRYLLSVGLMSVMSAAAAQTYGPQDEGRRFNDAQAGEELVHQPLPRAAITCAR